MTVIKQLLGSKVPVIIHTKIMGEIKHQSLKSILAIVLLIGLLSSCSTLERASLHGLNSGFYQLKSDSSENQAIYLDVSENNITVYPATNKQPQSKPTLTIPLNRTDSIPFRRVTFQKQGLDIDISTILFKYRPTIGGLPAQLTTDLNLAMYAGWRFDYYPVEHRKDPLNRSYTNIRNRGFDFGFFAGPGTTIISPFTTSNQRSDEYNGMIVQAGFAGFIESNIASFGLAVGYDYLLNSDRDRWIYQNKPWIGLVVGVALN
jgi:hypothetical protein